MTISGGFYWAFCWKSKEKWADRKSPLAGVQPRGECFFQSHILRGPPVLSNAKFFYQLIAVHFIFRSPLDIINTALIEEFLDKERHLIFAFNFTLGLTFRNAFCNASAFHFIKHITHIAWASFPVIGAGIICVFKSVVIRHDAQQLKRFLHMGQIL